MGGAVTLAPGAYRGQTPGGIVAEADLIPPFPAHRGAESSNSP